MNCTTSSATGSPQQPLSTPTTTQVQALRALLAKDSIDWFVIFSDDQHASEYTAPPDQRRSFMSGFTGSVGIAIVGRTTAHQFADGRYWVQATQQLDQNWTLHKVGATGVLPWDQWLLSQVNSGEKVGLNPKYVSYGAFVITSSFSMADCMEMCRRSGRITDLELPRWYTAVPHRSRSSIRDGAQEQRCQSIPCVRRSSGCSVDQ